MIEAVFVLAVFAVSLFNPFWGLCTIMSWNTLSDRVGAKISFSLAGVPIYVSEAALLGILIHLLRAYFKNRPRPPLPSWKELFLNRWGLLYGNAGFSFLRGLSGFSPTEAVRDAALLYYSVFTHLTPRLVESRKKLKLLAYVVGSAVILKLLTSILQTGLKVFDFSFQPGAYAIAVGLLLTSGFATWPLWGRKRPWVSLILVVAVSEFMLVEVRSAWLGMAAAFCFVLAAAILNRGLVSLKSFLHGAVVCAAGFLLSVYLPHYGLRPLKFTPKTGIMAPSTPESIPTDDLSSKPSPQPPGDLPLSQALPLVGMGHLMKTPGAAPAAPLAAAPAGSAAITSAGSTVVAPAATGMFTAREMVTPLYDSPVVHEMETLFMGLHSPNLLTRLYFWTEVVEDLVGVRFNIFTNIWENPLRMDPGWRNWKEGMIGRIRFRTEVKGAVPYFLVNSRALRFLNGTPFGEKFIPARIFWWLHETTRYDPHNSHLAILHRTGVIGFLVYLFIVFGFLRRGMAYLNEGPSGEARLVMLAVLACFVFIFVHAATDVTLENAYKGIPFWVLLGLITAVPRIYKNTPSA